MISSLSFWSFVITTTLSITTGFFWQDEYTKVMFGKYVRKLFGGKMRSLITAHIVFVIGFLVFFFLSPDGSIPEIMGVFVGGEVMLLGTGFGGFLNWRMGPWSHGARHGFIAKKIIEQSDQGSLDDAVLTAYLRSMVGESEKGNTASQKHLVTLMNRNDELGQRVKRIVSAIKNKTPG